MRAKHSMYEEAGLAAASQSHDNSAIGDAEVPDQSSKERMQQDPLDDIINDNSIEKSANN